MMFGVAAKLIGRLEVDGDADLAQVRCDIDHLIEVLSYLLF